MIRNAISMNFQCILESPFHTTHREYQNLLTCAPYILGTTIRGATLSYLIQKHCTKARIDHLKEITDTTRVAQFHRNCEENCPIGEFFDDKTPEILFSFGEFARAEYLQMTKIALRRDSRSASEGAIANIECIQEGSKFSFEVVLFNNLIDCREEIEEAIEFTGKYLGIGRFKSVGMGRFRVQNKRLERIEIIPEHLEDLDPTIEMTFQTPLVFKINKMDEKVIADGISESFYQRFHEISDQHNGERIKIKDLSIEMKPEFIHRYSLERSQVENRLVMDAGSTLRCSFDRVCRETLIQLKIASRFGVGEWRNCGFGRFHGKKSKRTH